MSPHRKTRNAAAQSRPLQVGSVLALLILIPVLAVTASDALRAALDFTSGVLSLVSLTSAVAWGLLARDRLLLDPRQRLLAQAVHRATAVASLGFLLLHAALKVALGHVSPIGAVLPFGLGVTGSGALIGLGSLAGFLMVLTSATGALRSAFAVPGRAAGRWRSLHALAYPAWCAALVHGLYAGREPAAWVVTMYCLCLAAVALALAARLLPEPLKRDLRRRVTSLTRPGGTPPAPGPAARDPLRAPLPGSRPAPDAARRPPVPAPPLPGADSRPPGLTAAAGTTGRAPAYDPHAGGGGAYGSVTHGNTPYETAQGLPHPSPAARWPAPSPPLPAPLGDTRQATAPLSPPPPGEPWSTPAGERP